MRAVTLSPGSVFRAGESVSHTARDTVMNVLPYPLVDIAAGRHDAWLWNQAAALRQASWGRAVFLRGIIEFSNHCRQNCLYCGLRRENAIQRYRLDAGEIFAAARAIKRLGIGTVVLQSGEDAQIAAPFLAAVIRRVKSELGLAVTLSVGEREPADYALWREAGADRYLLKVETFDEQAYAALRPGRKIEERLGVLESLRELGYECGSGLIGGLPGETPERLARDFTLLAGLRLDMISISPFTPHPATPLRGHAALDVAPTLRLMALTRVLAPTAHIPVTSALGLHGDAVRLHALDVGDVIMPSLTPERVRAAYSIYPGKNAGAESPEDRARAMRATIANHGFTVPGGPGGAWRLGREQAGTPGAESREALPHKECPDEREESLCLVRHAHGEHDG